MRFFYCLLFLFAINTFSLHAEGCYPKHACAEYEKFKHGVDGALLLDPYLLKDLHALEGKLFLDTGCGTGPWTVYAAQRGAKAYGIDIQKEMIERASLAVKLAGVEDQVELTVGNVAELPYQDAVFDTAISINVGCNLRKTSFVPHFREMFRCLKPGGKTTVSTLTSFGIVFTTPTDESAVNQYIKTVLDQINTDPSPERIVNHLNTLTEVLRATFVMREGRLVLITNEDELVSNEEIWRKIPGLTVPNIYHSESEYLRACQEAGFRIDHIDRPTGQLEQLGPQYEKYPAFAIFHLTKPSGNTTFEKINKSP